MAHGINLKIKIEIVFNFKKKIDMKRNLRHHCSLMNKRNSHNTEKKMSRGKIIHLAFQLHVYTSPSVSSKKCSKVYEKLLIRF